MKQQPKFTSEQKDWICYMIGEWYLIWKDKICPNEVPHRLGYAKEQLKNFLCGDDEEYNDLFT